MTGVPLSRLFLLLVIAALAGGFGASVFLGEEKESQGSLLSISGVGDVIPRPAELAATATAVPTPPCPSCGQNEQAWQAQTSVLPPTLLGRNAALIESCGTLTYGQLPYERQPAASLVKIATAIVAAEGPHWREEVSIDIDGWDLAAEDGSSIMGLQKGMRMTVEELVWGLMFRSGNDAAIEIARVHGGEQTFVSLMNAKAAALGLKDTQFRNAHGLDAPGAYSTTFDMAQLGKALLANPTLARMVRTKEHDTSWDSISMENGNWLLYVYPDAIGIKTGYTEEAGGTIVAAAERDGRVLIASIFDSADIFWDSMRLFDWAFLNTRSTC